MKRNNGMDLSVIRPGNSEIKKVSDKAYEYIKDLECLVLNHCSACARKRAAIDNYYNINEIKGGKDESN